MAIKNSQVGKAVKLYVSYDITYDVVKVYERPAHTNYKGRFLRTDSIVKQKIVKFDVRLA